MDVPAILVVFTNGDSKSSNETLQAASQCRLAGITIIVVAAGSWINKEVIYDMASYPFESNTIIASDYNTLSNFNSQLANIICNS